VTLEQQLIIKTVKSVVDAGPYPYKNTWEDYQRAVEDWKWKIIGALSPVALCYKCKDRDECVSYQSPYEIWICTAYDSRSSEQSTKVET